MCLRTWVRLPAPPPFTIPDQFRTVQEQRNSHRVPPWIVHARPAASTPIGPSVGPPRVPVPASARCLEAVLGQHRQRADRPGGLDGRVDGTRTAFTVLHRLERAPVRRARCHHHHRGHDGHRLARRPSGGVAWFTARNADAFMHRRAQRPRRCPTPSRTRQT